MTRTQFRQEMGKRIYDLYEGPAGWKYWWMLGILLGVFLLGCWMIVVK